MKQLAFLLDQRYCIGCQSCKTACDAKNNSQFGISFRMADSFEENATFPYLTSSCNHCEKPSCISACPVGAISKDKENGVVLIDSYVCIGCKKCVGSCIYSAIKFNIERNIAVKCNFCVDRLKKGESPACVDACPVKVLSYTKV